MTIVLLSWRDAGSTNRLAAEIAASGCAAPILIRCDRRRPDAGEEIAASLAAEVEYLVSGGPAIATGCLDERLIYASYDVRQTAFLLSAVRPLCPDQTELARRISILRRHAE
jgi:hypothetical protein